MAASAASSYSHQAALVEALCPGDLGMPRVFDSICRVAAICAGPRVLQWQAAGSRQKSMGVLQGTVHSQASALAFGLLGHLEAAKSQSPRDRDRKFHSAHSGLLRVCAPRAFRCRKKAGQCAGCGCSRLPHAVTFQVSDSSPPWDLRAAFCSQDSGYPQDVLPTVCPCGGAAAQSHPSAIYHIWSVRFHLTGRLIMCHLLFLFASPFQWACALPDANRVPTGYPSGQEAKMTSLTACCMGT